MEPPDADAEAPLWLAGLEALVAKKGLGVLRLRDEEWSAIQNARRGSSAFTVARAHLVFEGLAAGLPCLIAVEGEGPALYLALVKSTSAVSNLETRIKVIRSVRLRPERLDLLTSIIGDARAAGGLRSQLAAVAGRLTPVVGAGVIRALAAIEGNQGAMRAVAEVALAPRRYRGTLELQEDAIQSALAVFGLASDEPATAIDLVRDRATAIARLPILEDSVIEHDARWVPGFELSESDVTGRARFEREGESLEVFTANKRPLERAFGVDLIYFNLTRQNVVMLQYKMLEPERGPEGLDWVYRPDGQLDAELERMRAFAQGHPPGPYEYRLNPAVFYLKFVKRNGNVRNGAIITPVDHFQTLREDPSCRGPRGGLRVTYDSLSGRYLRSSAFVDLLRSGYIGAHADTAAALRVLVDAVLAQDRGVVAAIQQRRPRQPDQTGWEEAPDATP